MQTKITLAHAHIPEQICADFYATGKYSLGKHLAQPMLAAGISRLGLDLGGDWVTRVLNTASENYFWNAMNYLDVVLRQQEAQTEEEQKDSGQWYLIRCRADLDLSRHPEKLGILLCLGGGRPLEGKANLNTLSNLRHFWRLGVRAVQLSGYGRNRIADGVAEARTRGRLTYFGKDVVAEMERLGMVIDTAAINNEGFDHIRQLTDMPLLNSRANAAVVCPHPLNLTDERIKHLAAGGGVMALSFYADLIARDKKSPDVGDLVRHIEHIAGLVGTKHIALGGDISGMHTKTPTRYERHPGLVNGIAFTERDNDYAEGLDSPAGAEKVRDALTKLNYKSEDIAAITGGNLLRVYATVLKD